MTILLGTLAHNAHVQNLALALAEAGALGRYETGWVYRAREDGAWRRGLRRALPRLERELDRRSVLPGIAGYVRNRPGWEILRTAAGRLGAATAADWLHDRATFSLARRCARLLEQGRYSGYLGTEYGALEPLQAARLLGKTGILAILSPHHRFRETWLEREYAALPDVLGPGERRLLALGRERDRRRDAEAQVTGLIHVASRVTADSWIAAGVDPAKLLVAPLGAPPPVPIDTLPAPSSGPLRVLYAGQVALHKGIRHLLEAWRAFKPGPHAELHLCGSVRVPGGLLDAAQGNVVVHGLLAPAELRAIYRTADVLVFPTLCDGFGLVVGEAMSQGVPVIATLNAGASMTIRDGVDGFVVPPADAPAIADRLAWCLDNRAALHAMRREALAGAATHSWAAFRARVREQFSSLLRDVPPVAGRRA